MMPATAVAQLTFEEFERLADQPGKLEILQGELIELPPALRTHNQIARRIFRSLDKLLTESKPDTWTMALGDTYQQMGYKFIGNTWLQPDVSVAHAGQEGDKYFANAPALAVEIISESNSAEQVNAKIDEYLRRGAFEVWVLYPRKRHMWVYRPDGTAEMFSATYRAALFGGASFSVPDFLGD